MLPSSATVRKYFSTRSSMPFPPSLQFLHRKTISAFFLPGMKAFMLSRFYFTSYSSLRQMLLLYCLPLMTGITLFVQYPTVSRTGYRGFVCKGFLHRQEYSSLSEQEQRLHDYSNFRSYNNAAISTTKQEPALCTSAPGSRSQHFHK